MYKQIGMTRPDPEVAEMRSLAADYAALVGALRSAEVEVAGQINYVLANNSGPAADAFSASEKSAESIDHHLVQLVPAATRTSYAYSEAARTAASAAAALDGLDRRFDAAVFHAVFTGQNPIVIDQLVKQATTQMKAVENDAVAGIDSVFSVLELPQAFSLPDKDLYGRLDSRISDEFEKISREDPERAKQILQKMADDYADENGIPRVQLKFERLDAGTYGVRDSGDGSITLNSDVLSGEDSSMLLNTVIHEMEHSRQYEGMKPHWPWNPNRGNMSAEEGRRWKELNQDYVRSKGGSDNDYWSRPVEVGARDAGRDYINQMTYQEFKDRYLR